MKKLISFILVLSLLIGCTTASFATVNYTDMSLCDRQEAVQVLTDLNLIKGTGNAQLSPKSYVTRAEMATMVIRALGYDDLGQTKCTTPFKDVKATHWASGYVTLANQLGLVVGYNNKFYPNDSVTYQEVITILVRMIGIKDNALVGTWPMNYVLQAHFLDILGDVKFDDTAATREEVMQLLFNCLNTPMGKTDKNGVFSVYSPARTLMTLTKTTKSSTIVNFNDARALGDMTLVGKYIDKYVSATSGAVKSIVIKSTELDGMISGSAFVTSNASYKFADDAFAATAAVYVNNGSYATASTLNGLKNLIGTSAAVLNVNIKDGVISHVYTCETWKKTTTVQVTTADALTCTSASFKGYNFVMSYDAIDTDVLVINGAANIDAIKDNSVIDIYAVGDTITRMDVNTNAIIGVPIKLSNGKYTINNVDYKSNVPLTLGNTYVCYLGLDGVIAFATLVTKAETPYTTVYGFYVAQNTTSSWGKAITEYRIANVNGNVDTFVVPTPTAITPSVLYAFTIEDNKLISAAAVTTYTAVTYSGIAIYTNNIVARVATDCVIIAIDSQGVYSFTTLDKLQKNTNIAAVSGSCVILNDNHKVCVLTVNLEKTHGNNTTSYAIVNSLSIMYEGGKNVIGFNGFVDGVAVTDYAIKIDAWYSGVGIYEITKNADTITGMTAITSDCAVTVDEVVSNAIIFNNTDFKTLDKDVVVYFVSGSAFTLSKVNDITVGAKAQLFDTDADLIYDIVIWNK